MDDGKKEDKDDDGGWEILRPGVVLFETSMGDLDKPIPHPLLDDRSKMLRIIANPLYEQLTVSRAAHIEKRVPVRCVRTSSSLLNRPSERSAHAPFQSLNYEQTSIKPLQNSSSRLSRASPSLRLPSASLSNRSSPRSHKPPIQSRITTAHSTMPSVAADPRSNSKKSIADGTIRYVNSRHGFEVQRYSSSNCLFIDVFCKDACQAQEKTFRQMLDKKCQYERLSRSIYSSDYYHKRRQASLQCRPEGNRAHAEWAQRNYQLLCLRTLHDRASKREERDRRLAARTERQTLARTAFNEWKESKDQRAQEDRRTRISSDLHVCSNQAFTPQPDETSSITTAKAIDEINLKVTDVNDRSSSVLANANDEGRPSSLHRPKDASTGLYMLDEERWSLEAMLKRIVGLAQPLPAPPKLLHRPMTNRRAESAFDSL